MIQFDPTKRAPPPNSQSRAIPIYLAAINNSDKKLGSISLVEGWMMGGVRPDAKLNHFLERSLSRHSTMAEGSNFAESWWKCTDSTQIYLPMNYSFRFAESRARWEWLRVNSLVEGSCFDFRANDLRKMKRMSISRDSWVAFPYAWMYGSHQ